MSISNLAHSPVDAVAHVAGLHAHQNDVGARFPIEVLGKMRETGLLGCLVPVEFGGLGGSAYEMSDIAYRLARHCTSVGMIFAMHCQQSAAIIDHASLALQAELLPRIAAGDLYLASVTTEITTGGHLLTSNASSTVAKGQLEIDRFAPVCTGGSVADGFLISMLSPHASRPTETSLVYADRLQLTVESKGDWNPLGMRATASGPLHLSGSVPLGQLVGADGRFRHIVVNTFAPLGHIGWAACWLGCADGALTRVVRQLRRKGSSLSDIDRQRLSRVRLRSDATHALLTQVVNQRRSCPESLTTIPGQLLVNGLKIFASEQARQMVDELIELVGMQLGYMTDSPLLLERAWRDLRSAPLNYSNDRLDQADGALVLMDERTNHV